MAGWFFAHVEKDNPYRVAPSIPRLIIRLDAGTPTLRASNMHRTWACHGSFGCSLKDSIRKGRPGHDLKVESVAAPGPNAHHLGAHSEISSHIYDAAYRGRVEVGEERLRSQTRVKGLWLR